MTIAVKRFQKCKHCYRIAFFYVMHFIFNNKVIKVNAI